MSILHFEFILHIAFFEPDVDQISGVDEIFEVIYCPDNTPLNQVIVSELQND